MTIDNYIMLAIAKYCTYASQKDVNYIYSPNSVGTALGNNRVCSVLLNILLAKYLPHTRTLTRKYSNGL